ncbi:InlB B-repeat-containing protein, partial [Microgenomates group bacterium]|nr:InlB B-repeat-containing protein [Microgenomates group bacterium]
MKKLLLFLTLVMIVLMGGGRRVGAQTYSLRVGGVAPSGFVDVPAGGGNLVVSLWAGSNQYSDFTLFVRDPCSAQVHNTGQTRTVQFSANNNGTTNLCQVYADRGGSRNVATFNVRQEVFSTGRSGTFGDNTTNGSNGRSGTFGDNTTNGSNCSNMGGKCISPSDEYFELDGVKYYHDSWWRKQLNYGGCSNGKVCVDKSNSSPNFNGRCLSSCGGTRFTGGTGNFYVDNSSGYLIREYITKCSDGRDFCRIQDSLQAICGNGLGGDFQSDRDTSRRWVPHVSPVAGLDLNNVSGWGKGYCYERASSTPTTPTGGGGSDNCKARMNPRGGVLSSSTVWELFSSGYYRPVTCNNTNIALPNSSTLSRSGYRLLGFASSLASCGGAGMLQPGASVSRERDGSYAWYEACWEGTTPTERVFNVSFDLNGGTGAKPVGTGIGTDVCRTTSNYYTYTIPAPATNNQRKDGYTFQGWGKTSGCVGGARTGETTFLFEDNTTLYACWLSDTPTEYEYLPDSCDRDAGEYKVRITSDHTWDADYSCSEYCNTDGTLRVTTGAQSWRDAQTQACDQCCRGSGGRSGGGGGGYVPETPDEGDDPPGGGGGGSSPETPSGSCGEQPDEDRIWIGFRGADGNGTSKDEVTEWLAGTSDDGAKRCLYENASQYSYRTAPDSDLVCWASCSGGGEPDITPVIREFDRCPEDTDKYNFWAYNIWWSVGKYDPTKLYTAEAIRQAFRASSFYKEDLECDLCYQTYNPDTGEDCFVDDPESDEYEAQCMRAYCLNPAWDDFEGPRRPHFRGDCDPDGDVGARNPLTDGRSSVRVDEQDEEQETTPGTDSYIRVPSGEGVGEKCDDSGLVLTGLNQQKLAAMRCVERTADNVCPEAGFVQGFPTVHFGITNEEEDAMCGATERCKFCWNQESYEEAIDGDEVVRIMSTTPSGICPTNEQCAWYGITSGPPYKCWSLGRPQCEVGTLVTLGESCYPIAQESTLAY